MKFFINLFITIILFFNLCIISFADDELFSLLRTVPTIEYQIQNGDSLAKIATKYNTTVELLKKLNYISGSKIYVGRTLKILKGKFSISIDKSDNKLQLFLDKELIKTYVVATGKDNKTPVGKFKIVNKLISPTWYKPDSGEVIPPNDSRNELGTRWLGFDLDGYGIHGTIKPDSIGKQSTSGCVRMLNNEVEELFEVIPIGVEVTIVD